MAFLDQFQIDTIKGKIIDDLSNLGKTYKSKKGNYQQISVDHSRVEDHIKQGWEEYGKPLKTKTLLRKSKSYSKKFEDDVWCQFYELGFRKMNYDENLILPFSKNVEDKKQIDVIAIGEDTIFIIECKSAETSKKSSFKDEFDLLKIRLDGFKKALLQIYGNNYKIKYVFATRNFRFDKDSIDLERLYSTNSFLLDDNAFGYVNNLIKHYKKACLYQFLGMVFKNEKINNEKIEIPAVKGSMGKKTYYMFSIEPHLLLKTGYVLHRTRANISEFPTYQRLLIPKRLSGISKFIEDEGYFPNSVIINFNSSKNQIQFEASSKLDSSNSCFGTLKIPNAYGIAYIIDGQHRVYGYAGTKYSKTNTIPVVAFEGLESFEQLKIFMDINQNQKAVSPSLKLDLEVDLNWDSKILEYRIRALNSAIVRELANSIKSPLYNKISVAEDKFLLEFKPFTTALSHSGLIPKSKGNKIKEDSDLYCLYDILNQNHSDEMEISKKAVFELISLCYDFVENEYLEIFKREKYFIISNRGTYAFICSIGSINNFLIDNKLITKKSTPKERFEKIVKYLRILLDSIVAISKEDEVKQLSLLGAGADGKWLRYFQSLINKGASEYNPEELIEWNEKQNEELQNKGRIYGVAIEKYMKKSVLVKLQEIFKDKWELEIGSIKRNCVGRALEEDEKNHKEGLNKESVDWQDMFNINDYKTIIENNWSKKPTDDLNKNFITFEKEFSIDIGNGFNSKLEKIKWISVFNSHRNLWAHEGTKGKRLNKIEVEFIENIHDHFYK
ncbi:DNA sulfur modification protein DndB [Flavobacterium sp. CG_9.1]|uniref:DGQHR domain-containing protein n=1 Tax=Flavobacterium sp. CG_9.1 TaxID=2787728 RepID=UPI0018C935F8|nr:DGQHR domain-containing protein [Flavobacterium sp. CG_9.1]MBG6060471.1 DNA sulfur modification protein DndB [Flavobacterium sp. CG_9.1]